MNDDVTEVKDETIKRIRETPEDKRTGEEQAILGIDNALEAAKAAFENAGFKLDHLMVIFDVSESPDKNPEAPMMGMVIVPDHQECAIHLLGATIASVAGASGAVVRMMPGGNGGGQSGPIHHQ